MYGMKTKVLYGVIFCVGFMIFSFPMLSNYINNKMHVEVIEEYQEQVNELDEEELARKLQEAKEYNRNLVNQVTHYKDKRKEEVEQKLNSYPDIVNTGSAIGYITIPKINVELPIYIGVTDTVLSKGIGIVPNTSFPVGGEGTHAVLSGHRGLPTATLFRYLDELKVGDQFSIHTLDDTLTYEVNLIKIVLPYETDDLLIDPKKDYVTLVTCDPYMINSHRLLVRGIRAEKELAD